MGGNVKEAHLAQKRKRRKKRREEKKERLREERERGEWMHLTVAIEDEPYELWVKSEEDDEAVRLYAQEFLNKEYVSSLSPGTRWYELRDELKETTWIDAIRESLPEV